MSKLKTFADKYPHINCFVNEYGCIEIGYDDNISAFVKAYDPGGTVYVGKSSYKSMEAALEDLEVNIKAHLDDIGVDC